MVFAKGYKDRVADHPPRASSPRQEIESAERGCATVNEAGASVEVVQEDLIG